MVGMRSRSDLSALIVAWRTCENSLSQRSNDSNEPSTTTAAPQNLISAIPRGHPAIKRRTLGLNIGKRGGSLNRYHHPGRFSHTCGKGWTEPYMSSRHQWPLHICAWYDANAV